MTSVAHVPAPPASTNIPRHDLSPARHAALLRWFAGSPIGQVMDALDAGPRFPLIRCGEVADAGVFFVAGPRHAPGGWMVGSAVGGYVDPVVIDAAPERGQGGAA